MEARTETPAAPTGTREAEAESGGRWFPFLRLAGEPRRRWADLSRLEHRRLARQGAQVRLLVLGWLAFLVGAGGPGLIVIISRRVSGDGLDQQEFFLIGLCMLTALFLLVAAVAKSQEIGELEEDIRGLEFDEDLADASKISPMHRAERLLIINQHQLRRYYEQNLSQSFWIFLVGIACLAAGLGVIGVTFYLVHAFREDSGSQTLVAIMGSVGAVLTNFVAAMYLKMHAATTANLSGFHAKLVATHELFFANVLASRVLPDDKQADVIARMALAITRASDPLARPSEPAGDGG